MRRAPFTEKEKQFIRDSRLLMSSGELAEHFRCSKTCVQRFIRAAGLTPPKEVIEQFRSKGLTGRTISTPAIDRTLKALYLTIPEKALAVRIGKSSTFVRTRLRQLGLVIPRTIINQRIAESRIKTGNVSFNKGKKQSDYMSKAAIKRTKATRFKKGRLPANTLHDLAITVRHDKRGVKYLFIRIAVGEWQPLHRHNWELVYGAISAKMNLVFKDHNTMNCNVENLEILTNADLLRRNSLHNYPEPIARIIQLRGALNRQINKHLKRLKNEEQN